MDRHGLDYLLDSILAPYACSKNRNPFRKRNASEIFLLYLYLRPLAPRIMILFERGNRLRHEHSGMNRPFLMDGEPPQFHLGRITSAPRKRHMVIRPVSLDP
mmetsp:Transcript_192/g.335  ORF Transcript_192/g.335 Transcript_192/m.335 type:complete len:102 (-) Transcript_192:1035-1340(-)